MGQTESHPGTTLRAPNQDSKLTGESARGAREEPLGCLTARCEKLGRAKGDRGETKGDRGEAAGSTTIGPEGAKRRLYNLPQIEVSRPR